MNRAAPAGDRAERPGRRAPLSECIYMRLKLTFLALATALYAYAQDAGMQAPFPDSDKPEVTEVSNVPWTPSPPVPQPKVVYGEDDRIDVYQESSADRRGWAAATCALIYTTRMTQNLDGSYTLSAPAAYRRFGLPPCAGEPFGDQPTAPFCTGFMVGPDLIVTAGHCYNSSYFESTRFVFGFYMEDATTPRFEYSADEVYKGVEIVSYASSGSTDHCVVRVDREIRAPGARPFRIRREGVIQPGEYVGVIGHPAGLPLKIAFGDTYVRSSTDPGYFVANLDTYGGNSGSPVINAGTGILEGILVRGDTDFISRGTCFESYVNTNDGGRGEDVTKATVFASRVPDIGTNTGTIALDNTYYACGASIAVTVTDPDLSGVGAITISMESSAGDTETLLLSEDTGQLGRFTATLATQPGNAMPGSGILEAGHGDAIFALYLDAEDENGEPAQAAVSASIDCYPPIIANVTVSFIGATQAQISFTTDESAQGIVRYGLACADLAFQSTGATTTNHVVSLSGLSPNTRYYFAVEARDPAGNTGVNDGGGACYEVMTYSTQNHFTEYFNTQNLVDIEYKQVTYIPVDTPNRYQACTSTVTELPLPATGQTILLADDGFQEMPLPAGVSMPFYGLEYDRIYIGSNGYVTFGTGDTSYQALPSQHFLLPRVSALMCDLNPSLRGTVTYAPLNDRCVVTFTGVPVFDGTGVYPPENSHTFQMEFFYSGIIRVTWLEIATVRAICGLSAGIGAPTVFNSIKITQFADCDDMGYEGICHSADTDKNWHISLPELLRGIQLYQSGSYSCATDSPDGYQPGDGPQDCPPHLSDYSPQDWRISLGELLRLIQLYNAGGYRPASGTEDGYEVIP